MTLPSAKFCELPAELVWKVSRFCGMRDQITMKLTCLYWNSVVEVDLGRPDGEKIRDLLLEILDLGGDRTGLTAAEKRRNIFIMAANCGNLQFVDYFLTFKDIGNSDFWSGFHAAGSGGQVGVVNLLLRRYYLLHVSPPPPSSESDSEEVDEVDGENWQADIECSAKAHLFSAMKSALGNGHVNFITAFISNPNLVGHIELRLLFQGARLERGNGNVNTTEMQTVLDNEIKRRKL